jgi:N-acyl-D-amino-acid deacylase
MGDRAIRLEAARPDDIAEMRRLTIEALRAGAFGFTTSRTDSHKTPVGEMVPSRYAASEELLGIGAALGDISAGAFGMNSDFDDEDDELAWLTKLAKETGRPVWFLLTDRYEDPERWRRLLAAVHAARADGANLTAQIAGRPIGVMLGIGTALNPFSVRPSYRELDGLSIPEQRRRLRDPALRRRILDEKPSAEEVSRLAQFRQLITTSWDKFFVMGDPPDYEPPEEASCAAIAAREGRTPDEVVYDYLTEAKNRYLFFPVVNYVCGDHEPIREMLTDSGTLLGLSDGGAHCASIIDAGVPTYMLLHWGRDRRRATPAARAIGETANQRDGGLLWLARPRPAHAGAARRCQPHRLRSSAALPTRARQRSPRRRPPLRATGRRVCRHVLGRNADVRKGRAHRCAARPARARGARVVRFCLLTVRNSGKPGR